MVLDVNMSHEKMSDYVLFPMSELTLVVKLRNFVRFLRSLKYLMQKYKNTKMVSDLIMSGQTVSDLV